VKQEEIISGLPAHLRQFVQVQDYSQYTPRDHAVWRFLMLQLKYQLAHSAHPVYIEGLRRTGISQEHIPSIDGMNECLEQIGWRALGVDGFIPPAVFMEFQSLRILVIAMSMRTIDQLLYTPAPDILHESAGHASFLIDVDYAEFLQQFGTIGMKALSSKDDEAVYEAIRHLSMTKENPKASEQEVTDAESNLANALDNNSGTSEAALLARLHWWTVEYGLVGDLDDYTIFGAGLLSSLGESKNCLDDSRVKKLLLTPDAISQAYDITSEQPQLYVTHSCRHLSQVLNDVANGMAQTRGGASSVRQAIEHGTVCTLEYNSGMQVSGIVSNVITDAMDNIGYIQTNGATQLSWQGKQLNGHGTGFHAAGFGSPVGFVNEFSRCLSEYSIDELRFAGIETGSRATLEFVSGVVVEGHLLAIERSSQRNILFSFKECHVTGAGGDVLFDPAWGQYDMAIGTEIISVFGGSADPSEFPLYRAPKERSPVHSPAIGDQANLSLYEQLIQVRVGEKELDAGIVSSILDQISSTKHPDWLLLFELFELSTSLPAQDRGTLLILNALNSLVETLNDNETIKELVLQGIERVRQSSPE